MYPNGCETTNPLVRKIMNDLVTMALAKTFEKQAKAIKIPAGEYAIDTTLTISVKGTVKKLDDHLFTPTVDIPLLTTMALLLEKSGFQRELSKDLLIEAMQEALAMNVEASEVVAERVKDIEAAMLHVQEVTAALPKRPRSGATYVTVQILDETPAIVSA